MKCYDGWLAEKAPELGRSGLSLGAVGWTSHMTRGALDTELQGQE